MKNINLNTAEPKRQKPAELRRPILHHVKTVNYKVEHVEVNNGQ